MLKRVINKIMRYGGYKIDKIKQVPDPFSIQKRLMSSDSPLTIFDVGAHCGETAKTYTSIFPQATIYSFEPFDESFTELVAVASNHQLIKAYCLAISDVAGSKKFYVNQKSYTNSLLPRPRNLRRYYPSNAETVREIEVETTTLDKFCQESSISKINILKMDIQGGELLALKGATSLLSQGCIDLIYTEAMFIPHYENCVLFHELSDFLSKYKYSLYDLFLVAHGSNGQLRYGDAIFLSNKIRTEVVDLLNQES